MFAKRDRIINRRVKNAICLAPLFEFLIARLRLKLPSALPVNAEVKVLRIWVILEVCHLLSSKSIDIKVCHCFNHLNLRLKFNFFF